MNAACKAFAALCLAVLGVSVASVAQAGGPGKRGIIPRAVLAAVHADVTAINAKGESKTITWDRGTVSATSDTSITLSRKDGKTVALTIDASTKTRGEVEQGRPAVVFSKAGTAVLILGYAGRPAAWSARAGGERRHGPGRRGGPFGVPRGAVHVGWSLILRDGKTASLALDRGEVTAVNSSSITLKRADNQSVTSTIDAKTKVRAKDDKIEVGDRARVISQGGTALLVLAGRREK